MRTLATKRNVAEWTGDISCAVRGECGAVRGNVRTSLCGEVIDELNRRTKHNSETAELAMEKDDAPWR